MLIWIIAAAAIGGILFRPKNLPEAIWACTGAALLVLLQLIPLSIAAIAIGKGTDVYLFLTGMMLLAELARREGVFDWVASLAVALSKTSLSRLFLLVYCAGTAVTVFLSNDATAVVLTPAVYAAVKKARAPAMPYLLACAFVANAASFVLPISNPANLVVYGRSLPPLLSWLRMFAFPSLLSIGATFLALRLYCRKDLAGRMDADGETAVLSERGRRAVQGIAFTAAVLLAGSGFGLDLGLPTCLAAACAVVFTTRTEIKPVGAIFRGVSWSILPLVAGLFVLVEGMNRAGAAQLFGDALHRLAEWPAAQSALAASFGISALSNVMNNLPSGLLAGGALQHAQVAPRLRDAILIGVDLGPNLSVTGSLATVLWLIALRREGENISGWTFLKAGAIVMPPALLLATFALLL